MPAFGRKSLPFTQPQNLLFIAYLIGHQKVFERKSSNRITEDDCSHMALLQTLVELYRWNNAFRKIQMLAFSNPRSGFFRFTFKCTWVNLLLDFVLVKAAAGCSRRIFIWHVTSTELLLKIDTEHADWIVAIAFSPDSRTLCSVAKHDAVKFWDVESGDCSSRFDVSATGLQNPFLVESVKLRSVCILLRIGNHDHFFVSQRKLRFGKLIFTLRDDRNGNSK